jgi:hypothetical protein
MRAIDRLLRHRPTAGGMSLAGKIRALFSNGEQGWWYDPSNFATLFQDSAGTTPVTAMEQPVGLQLDLSKGLTLGSELVTNGDFSGGSTGWTYFVGGTSTASISGGQATITKGSGIAYIAQSLLVQNTVYSCTLDIVSITGTASVQNGNSASYGSFTTAGTKTFTFMHNVANANMYLSADSGTVVFDNVSIKQVAGNHRFQSTSANRPVVSARVNLLTKTEEFGNAVWEIGAGSVSTTVTPNVGVAPDGTTTADRITFGSVSGAQYGVLRQGVTTVAANYTSAIYLKASAAGDVGKVVSVYANDTTPLVLVNHTLTSDWARVSGTDTLIATTSFFSVGTLSASNGGVDQGGFSVLVWGADLRVSNIGVGLPAYQRVNTSTDYDSTGFPTYIKPNGSNQFMVTNSINFTATDKMTVWQGVRKLSDASTNTFLELGTNSATVAGTFGAFSTPNGYRWRTGGTILVDPSIGSGYAAPVTNVFTGIGNISGDSALLRVNGTQVADNTADQGTGNYGNYPAYFYMRAGTSLPFNGHDYGSIARGAASTAAQITAGETYINKLTKAY